MLSIHWIQDVDYYLDQATPDYYFRPGEPPGRWWGGGAKTLGMIGTVTADQLKALCQGFAPDGKPLIQNAGADDHQQAWDFTFSAPKSVSVLWSAAPRAVRLKIRKLHHKAIKTALAYLTEVALLTRRSKAGKWREAAQPIAAIFEHGSNRELEPQLHSHCVLVNVAARIDGTFGTILSKPLYDHKMTAGAIYQTQLAYLLRKELGLRIKKEETAFSVVGIPQKLLDHYSTRAKQIREELGVAGHHTAKAAAKAALDTRKSKRSPPPRGKLLRRWQKTNDEFGFTEQDTEKLLGKIGPLKAMPDLTKAIENGIEQLLRTESYFSEQRLIRSVAIQMMGEGISATHIIEQVSTYIATNNEIIPIGIFHDEAQFTTREMLALEKQLFRAIEASQSQHSHPVSGDLVERLLNQKLSMAGELTADERTRNKEQRTAVAKLTMAPGGIAVLEGMAGTGKTYTLSVAREIWEKAGYQVTGMALSAVAARNLQEGSGIESDTIAMRLLQLDGKNNFARHHKRQLKRLITGKRTYSYRGRQFRFSRNSIVVVDEAGMVGTRQLVELIEHVRKAGAKLVLIGDRRQLQPVDAGGPFRPVADNSPKANLQHVVRQEVEPHDPNPTWHRQAGKLIAAGKPAEAIKLFAERGRFHVYDDLDSTMLAMVRNWSVEGIKNPTDNILLAGTNAAVAQLNARCQQARLSAGVLGDLSMTVGDNRFHIGDVILFTRNSRVHGVNNGDRGILVSLNAGWKIMAVKLEATGKTVFLEYSEYQDFQLGYSMTTHKAQGGTVPSVHVLLGGPMQDRHLSYVQATRAKESTRLYVDRHSAGPQLRGLLQQMERNRPKRLASEVQALNESQPAPSASKDNMTAPEAPASPTPSKNDTPTKKPTESVSEPKPPIKTKDKVAPRQDGPSRPDKLKPRSPIERPVPNKSPVKPGDAKPLETAAQVVPPAAPPTPKLDDWTPPEPPPRDLLDLRRIRVKGAVDSETLLAAVKRYGKLPGGIVVEGQGTCDVPIRSLTFDPARPRHLTINDSLHFDTGLSAEEMAILWDAVLHQGTAAENFGALSQTETIGVERDTRVALAMMKADNALGGIVYGHDSQFNLRISKIPSYKNPFLADCQFPTLPANFSRLALNYLDQISPQVFLKVEGVHFAAQGKNQITVTSSQITAALGVVGEGSKVIGSLSQAPGKGPLVAERFPAVYRAHQELLANFEKYAAEEPALARTVAYCEVVLLLRLVKASKAALHGGEHVRQILALRQHLRVPRFNYTLRSAEFANAARKVARELASYIALDWPDGLMAAAVGLRFAMLAGDCTIFLKCKASVRRYLRTLEGISAHQLRSREERELLRLAPEFFDRLGHLCHDTLIANCTAAAFAEERTAERETYLKDALRLCGPETHMSSNSATRCRWVEIKSALEPNFNALPELAKIRRDDPLTILPYATFNVIVCRRRGIGERSLTSLQRQYPGLGVSSPIELPAEPAEADWLLVELTRFGIPVSEYQAAFQQANQKQPRHVLWRLMADKLSRLPADSFSMQYLHRDNPLVFSHELVDFEPAEQFDQMFDVIRPRVETTDLQFVPEQSRPRKLLAKLVPALKPDHPGFWWREFLQMHAGKSKSGMSKVALVLAYELKARGLNVKQLYEIMRKQGTKNPQAALFQFDSSRP